MKNQNTKSILKILAALTAAICLMTAAGIPAFAKTNEVKYETADFFGGFISCGNSRWTVKDGALTNGASGKDGRSVVAFDAALTGTESFKYEVVYSYTGYGVGLTFKTVDEDGYFGVETNGDQPNGKIYSMKRDPGWSIWQLSHVEINEKTDVYDLVFEWDASSKKAVISLNGTVYNTAEGYDAAELAGKVGFFTEDASVNITKAELTVGGNKQDLLGAIVMPGNGSGEWTITADGLVNYRNGDTDRAVAVFGIGIDGTKSFKYEAVYTYEGYGVGPAFKAVDQNGYYALETNVDNYVYSLKRTPDWSIWQLSHTNIEPKADTYDISFEWDASSRKAVITLNGTVYNTANDYDAAEIAGSLGFFTEGGAVAKVSALTLTVTEELPDDPTDDPATNEPAATDEPAATGEPVVTDEPAPKTSEPVPSTGDAALVPAVIVLASSALLLAAVFVTIKKRA
ncbi:MAG: hypothetical protein J5950_09785 [Clostridia bacterium]|nr:hypothetical protein [Clostridia bacterium]